MMRKKDTEKNYFNIEDLLERSVRMNKTGHKHGSELKTILRAVATKGPTEFRFNYHLIHYNIKDEYGNFKLHWLVCNGITGNHQVFFTKDYIGKTGKVRWIDLARDMRKV